MLAWAVVFFVLAVFSALATIGGLAAFTGIKLVFVVATTLFALSAIAHIIRD